MFLSFIIPLYNSELYIAHCLDCILSSRVSNELFEIIIINDGSNDRGPQICQGYIKRHPNIKMISQKNQGASTARNMGIDIAKGEYIWFVDSDDSIIPSFFENIFSYLKNHETDLICFNYKKNYVNNSFENVDEFKHEICMSSIAFLKGHYSNFLWNKIYRKSALNGIKFLDGTKNIEDMLFNMCSIINMNEILCVPKYGYQYNCTNMNSTSRSLNLRNLVKLDQDSIFVLLALKSFVEKQNSDQKKIVLNDNLNFSIAGHLYSLFKFYSPKRLKIRIKQYRYYNLYPVPKTYNKRSNIFLFIANHEKIFVGIMIICRIWNKIWKYNHK